MKMRTYILSAVVLFLVGATSFQSKAESEASAGHGFQKVIVVFLENTNVDHALKTPFLRELTQRGATLKHMSGETHPSQPNYISMIAGDSLGVWNDSNVNLKGQHLGDLLESHGRTWKNYAEGLPSPCFTGATQGKYARKHVPFISFTNVSEDSSRCRNVVDSSEFDQDVAEGTLPDFSFYSPDLNDDGHDTNVDVSAKFMESRFGKLLRDPEFMKDKLFVVTFDESEEIFSNDIYTVLLGAGILPGSSTSQKLNHISILRLIEEEWGLGSLSRKDSSAVIPEGIWQ